MNNEDIKVLEEFIKDINLPTDELLKKHINLDGIEQAIENLIKGYKELEVLFSNTFKDNVAYLEKRYVEENYISKSKVKELLKRLDKEEKQELKGTKGQDRYFIKQIYQAKRSNIEGLLQEGDK